MINFATKNTLIRAGWEITVANGSKCYWIFHFATTSKKWWQKIATTIFLGKMLLHQNVGGKINYRDCTRVRGVSNIELIFPWHTFNFQHKRKTSG